MITCDLYEYMLSKITSAGTNGQFRTPRHIIQFMVQKVAPGPRDEISGQRRICVEAQTQYDVLFASLQSRAFRGEL